MDNPSCTSSSKPSRIEDNLGLVVKIILKSVVNIILNMIFFRFKKKHIFGPYAICWTRSPPLDIELTNTEADRYNWGPQVREIKKQLPMYFWPFIGVN